MRRNHHLKYLMAYLAIILLSIGIQSSGASEHNPSVEESKDRQIIVYYFHGNVRCHTCKQIEKLTQEAVKEAFQNQMKRGLIELKTVNVEEQDNKHYSKDYQLFTRSVIISEIVGGKEKQWKNLKKVWEYVQDEKKFKDYIQAEIIKYL